MPAASQWISFTTDYGLVDPFVGVCHGVIARIAPHARVIDVCHGVARGDVGGGALVLADCVAYLPDGVHLAVVDPGVGTDRRAVAVRAGDGQLLVGPDNGLLLPAADRLGGVEGAWELTSADHQVRPVSRTFHGRDIFAPAAAHLAAGTPPERLGPGCDPSGLVRPDSSSPLRADGQLAGEVVTVDTFGNAALNMDGDELRRAGLAPGDHVVVRIDDHHADATIASAFADVADGDLAVLVDSFGRASLAVNRGDAAQRLHLRRGTQVTVSRRPTERRLDHEACPSD